MSENKKNADPSAMMSDEDMDLVSGGYYRGQQGGQGPTEVCRNCLNTFPASSLTGGYCGACLNKLSDRGGHIII